jgi:hypothetical protein
MVHLVPTKGDQTWEIRIAKHVHVLGIEDKRQITIVVSPLAKRSLLPLQVVFQRTTNHTLPPINHGKKECYSIGFHLTNKSNHGPIWKPFKDLWNTSPCPTRRIEWRSLLY